MCFIRSKPSENEKLFEKQSFVESIQEDMS